MSVIFHWFILLVQEDKEFNWQNTFLCSRIKPFPVFSVCYMETCLAEWREAQGQLQKVMNQIWIGIKPGS